MKSILFRRQTQCRKGWCGGLRQSNKGNVLFIILIAVMLFGALTAAITRSERGSGSLDKERGLINASDYMAYTSTIEKTVARMLSNDMSENQLSFANDVWEFNDGTKVETDAMFANCTTDSCKVFHPAGGGLDVKTFADNQPPSPGTGDIKSGHAGVFSLKVTGVGTDAHDLVLMVAVVDRNTCRQINEQMKIVNPGNAPPADGWAGAALYGGAFSGPDDATDEIGDAATQIVGKTAGCISRTPAAYGEADNWVFQVLLPR